MVTKPKVRKTENGYVIRIGEVIVTIHDRHIFVIGAIQNAMKNEKMVCSASLDVVESWKI